MRRPTSRKRHRPEELVAKLRQADEALAKSTRDREQPNDHDGMSRVLRHRGAPAIDGRANPGCVSERRGLIQRVGRRTARIRR